MSILTLEIPEELADRLTAAGYEKNMPAAQIAVELLQRGLQDPPVKNSARKSVYDAMVEIGALGCVDSGVTDLGTNPKYLKGLGE